ncbi:CDPF1 [Symbiodinium pilosum]|uniref:CDPF1 protein n=1 Tax=Symbiodinium pilosum TaxID=2952 RepID=A0A812URV2_SYMPI|nr:CDPF1 [Symbiodinium pilosum]
MPPKQRGDFVCSVCGFRCRYDFFGKDPPFGHKAVRWVEDIFALQNPSSAEYGSVQTICLGALCSACSAPVCVDDKCSLFYKLRFCRACARQAEGSFPPEVAEGLSKDLRKILPAEAATRCSRLQVLLDSLAGSAARLTLGGDKAASATYFAVYGFGFLGQASYILVLGQCLQGVFFQSALCLPWATALSCLLCLPIGVSVRHLSDSVILCFINLFLILAVLAIVMAKMYFEGRASQVNTFAFAEDLTFWSVFGAASNVVYSYAGHWLYFELMADMQTPEHFPLVFLINAPLQVFLYLLVACWGYHFAGDQAQGYFLDNLPDGEPYRWASILLFAHVAIAFLVKNVVISRALHMWLSPNRADVGLREPGGVRSQAEFAGCVVCIFISAWAIANSIPFFSDLLALIGSVLSGPTSFLLPIAFWLGARRVQAGDSRIPMRSGECQMGEVQANRPRERMACEVSPTSNVSVGSSRIALSWMDVLACTAIAAFIVITMGLGTSHTLNDIAHNIRTYGRPFDCQARHARGGTLSETLARWLILLT